MILIKQICWKKVIIFNIQVIAEIYGNCSEGFWGLTESLKKGVRLDILLG
jgi:hypothetical protein